MILIGRYLSPFVRRSATLIQLAGLEYEQREVTTDQVDELSAFNPLARVPALDIGEAEAIVDSAAIYSRGQTEDAREGVMSFLEKRNPVYPVKVSDGMPSFFPWWDDPEFQWIGD